MRKPDLVILSVKYISLPKGEDTWLSEFFEKNEINYTGSYRDILRFDSNKILAKEYLIKSGIPTAKYFSAVPGEYSEVKDLPLPFPLFLKPSDAANGNGIDDNSYVTNFIEYEKEIQTLFDEFKIPILVEEYLDGREYTVAIIKQLNSNLLVSVIEIIPPKSKKGIRTLGAIVKKNNVEELIKVQDYKIFEKVKELAIDSFMELGIRDFGSIDIKTNNDGDCFFMEVNMVPGLTKGSSYFPKACEIGNDFSYDTVINMVTENGLNRVPGYSYSAM